jgi:hypothetical protein
VCRQMLMAKAKENMYFFNGGGGGGLWMLNEIDMISSSAIY